MRGRCSVISASRSSFRSFWIWLMGGCIAFRPAVEPSCLQKEEQSVLLEQIAYADATPSLAQVIKLKRFSQDGKLNNEVIESIMSEEKPNLREKINIKCRAGLSQFRRRRCLRVQYPGSAGCPPITGALSADPVDSCAAVP